MQILTSILAAAYKKGQIKQGRARNQEVERKIC